MMVASIERAVLNPDDRRNKDRIFNHSDADNAKFDRWLTSVKKPTWWQAGGATRERCILTPLDLTAILAMFFLLIEGMGAIWSR
jgi:hypothetical protein